MCLNDKKNYKREKKCLNIFSNSYINGSGETNLSKYFLFYYNLLIIFSIIK